MNIINCNNNFYIRGGSDKIFFTHMEIMREFGHNAIPFAPKDDNSTDSKWVEYFPNAIDIKEPNLLNLPKFFYNRDASEKLEDLLTDTDIDIAHLHIYYGRLTTSILQVFKKYNIPVVQTLHDYKLICPNSNLLCNEKVCEACQGAKFWKAFTKVCNDNSIFKSAAITLESYLSRLLGDKDKVDHFIAVSQFLKNKLIEFGLESDKISVVNNPIDTKSYEPDYNPGNYFLYFGRIEKIKGISSMLEAAIKAKVELILVGEGDEKERLEKLYAEKESIKFLGFQSGQKLQNLIANSICTICPSICYDIFPTTILESFALGKPVIGSNIGGIPEMIDHEENGLLFEPGNVDDLVEKLHVFKNQPNLGIDFGKKGRAKVEKQYNTEKYYKEIMKVYSSIGVKIK